jgi:hypothetical protein
MSWHKLKGDLTAGKAGNLNVTWIHGSPNCATTVDPPIQVHRFDDDTFILRQSKCSEPGTPATPGSSFEAPFMYLLVGSAREDDKFRNDGQLKLLSDFKERNNSTKDWRYAEFLVVNFELENPASLSWYLSSKERIDNGIERVQTTVDRLSEWWHGGAIEPAGPP